MYRIQHLYLYVVVVAIRVSFWCVELGAWSMCQCTTSGWRRIVSPREILHCQSFRDVLLQKDRPIKTLTIWSDVIAYGTEEPSNWYADILIVARRSWNLVTVRRLQVFGYLELSAGTRPTIFMLPSLGYLINTLLGFKLIYR